MAGDLKLQYVADTAMTVTNLHSLAASQTHVAGWTSAAVNNTSNEYADYAISGTLTTHASNRQAGHIEVWALAAIEDTPTWPATATGTPGTEGALSFTAVEMLQSWGVQLTSFSVTSTASQIYAFSNLSLADAFGSAPAYWCLFITGDAATTTTAQFASAGSAIYYKPVNGQYT